MANANYKKQVVELRRQLFLARNALEKISTGHSRNPEREASDALEEIWKLDPKQQLQGLVGHPSR